MPGVALNYDNDSSRSCFDALFVQNHVNAKLQEEGDVNM